MIEARHESVLMREVLEALAVAPAETVVDATIGGAGHFAALLARLGPDGTLIGLDADEAAVERARAAVAAERRAGRPVVHAVNDDFRNLARVLDRLGIGAIDAALFDLGWSGYQLASGRGFSFAADEPLLMHYASSAAATTAAQVVNSASERELAELLKEYGEERFARGIARAIVAARKKERILSTGALVAAVLAGTPRWYHSRRVHPATKTFQALRLAVNDELGSIREGLGAALARLAPGGRLAVISFHSIEDRLVKTMLREAAAAYEGSRFAHLIAPSRAEIFANHRARSAKLRLFVRAASKPIPARSAYCYA